MFQHQNKPNQVSTFQTSACISFTYMPLTIASHMANRCQWGLEVDSCHRGGKGEARVGRESEYLLSTVYIVHKQRSRAQLQKPRARRVE